MIWARSSVWIERLPSKQKVAGSNPVGSAGTVLKWLRGPPAERLFAGSNPASAF